MFGRSQDILTTSKMAQIQPARGFDRLTAAGFSEADIANFRRQFHSQSSANYLDTEFETEEECEFFYIHPVKNCCFIYACIHLDSEHARALEEQWIDSLDNTATASLSQTSSTNSSVLQGIILGFFFPLLPFFFMRTTKMAVFWDDGSECESPSSVIFS
jgi:DUF2407 C-terminal domain